MMVDMDIEKGMLWIVGVQRKKSMIYFHGNNKIKKKEDSASSIYFSEC